MNYVRKLTSFEKQISERERERERERKKKEMKYQKISNGNDMNMHLAV